MIDPVRHRPRCGCSAVTVLEDSVRDHAAL